MGRNLGAKCPITARFRGVQVGKGSRISGLLAEACGSRNHSDSSNRPCLCGVATRPLPPIITEHYGDCSCCNRSLAVYLESGDRQISVVRGNVPSELRTISLMPGNHGGTGAQTTFVRVSAGSTALIVQVNHGRRAHTAIAPPKSRQPCTQRG